MTSSLDDLWVANASSDTIEITNVSIGSFCVTGMSIDAIKEDGRASAVIDMRFVGWVCNRFEGQGPSPNLTLHMGLGPDSERAQPMSSPAKFVH